MFSQQGIASGYESKRQFTEFAGKSTSGPNKEAFERDVINHFYSGADVDYVVTMVGATDGVERHDAQFCEIVPQHKVVMVERDPTTFAALNHYITDSGYSHKVVFGDFRMCAEELLKKGHRLLLDFDGTSPISDQVHYDLIDLMIKYPTQIDRCAMVYYGRSGKSDPNAVRRFMDYAKSAGLYCVRMCYRSDRKTPMAAMLVSRLPFRRQPCAIGFRDAIFVDRYMDGEEAEAIGASMGYTGRTVYYAIERWRAHIFQPFDRPLTFTLI